jgi:glycosyltransferase involved in cell wall biosynthesis
MLTVLIATRNGGRTLPGVLEAYGRAQVPAGGFKVVIVDNGSTDGTSGLASRFRDILPLTWIVEAEPGKNAALNRGLSAVEGDLVVLTDDDAFPRTDLLVRLRAAADAHAGFSIFGGAVVARWEVPPPEWLLRWVPPGPAFTLTPPALGEGPTGPHNVFGPNMAVRATVFEAGHRFDPSIGPRGGHYAMGSETEFVRRLIRQGHSAWHVPDAVVEHFVREAQMTRAWVRARAVRFGRGQFRLAQADGARAAPSWLGVPRYLIRGMCAHALRMAQARASLDEERFFLAQWEFHCLWGQAIEARAMRNEAPKG